MVGRIGPNPPGPLAGLAVEIRRDLSAVWVADRIPPALWAGWALAIPPARSAGWAGAESPGPVGGVGVGRRNGVGLLR